MHTARAPRHCNLWLWFKGTQQQVFLHDIRAIEGYGGGCYKWHLNVAHMHHCSHYSVELYQVITFLADT
jgi:hypothetical protein